METVNAPASKRVRIRQHCPYCGVNLGKSSYSEHILECSKNDNRDSSFEIPSDDDDVVPTPSVSSRIEGKVAVATFGDI